MDQKFSAAIDEYERANPSVQVDVAGTQLVYATPNKACLWRVQTLATKEPDTISWLESMPENANFLDIGANVGMYTVYAGVLRRARVFAFEPESQNYAVLCRNIALNNIGATAIAWCAALSDEQKFDRIFISDFSIGASCHTFGENLDPFLKGKEFPFTQGSYATTVDQLVGAGTIPVPAYIKIDVDGLEHKVIGGAVATLRDPSVRSLLIEINPHLAEHRSIFETLSGLGFTYDERQFASAQRKEGYFKGVGECIFSR